MALLNVIDLNVNIPTTLGVVQASNGVSLRMGKGESHCLIGESGCGKTIVALGIMRLLPGNAKVQGQMLFRGQDLFCLSKNEMRKIRGREIAMIFEQPQSCFNPVFSVGDQIAEAVQIHEGCSKKNSRLKAMELMTRVEIPEAQKRYRQYPHEYSGGMAQRAMIAMAMALKPSLLIADEPTTALDVTLQARILELIRNLVSESGASLLLITHDLEVAFRICENVSVMYAGSIVESGPVKEIIDRPGHPYTEALLGAISNEASSPLKGIVPELTRLPTGCPFHPRCKASRKICREERPRMRKGVRCHFSAGR